MLRTPLNTAIPGNHFAVLGSAKLPVLSVDTHGTAQLVTEYEHCYPRSYH